MLGRRGRRVANVPLIECLLFPPSCSTTPSQSRRLSAQPNPPAVPPLLQHDDAILPTTARAYRQVCDSRKNPDGCAFRATMFTQAVNTDCELAKKMWEDGYEIATHTANHIQMPEGFPHNRTVGARRPRRGGTPHGAPRMHVCRLCRWARGAPCLQRLAAPPPGRRRGDSGRQALSG